MNPKSVSQGGPYLWQTTKCFKYSSWPCRMNGGHLCYRVRRTMEASLPPVGGRVCLLYILPRDLFQNTYVVSSGKVTLIFGCYQSIPKIIIAIGWLKTVDINKCHAWPISKTLFKFAMKSLYFSDSEFTVIYTQYIHKNIHKTSLEFTVHIHNIDKFNSQIVYSQHRSKIQYSQHRPSIFTLFLSTSLEITVQRIYRFHNCIVEETLLMCHSCRRIFLVHWISHGAITYTSRI
jgi:hypothetical protein